MPKQNGEAVVEEAPIRFGISSPNTQNAVPYNYGEK